MARATNDGFEIALPDQEVAAIARSVERYRDGWIAQGRVYTEAERTAWGRSLGLASAAARRAANARRDFRIIEGHRGGLEPASPSQAVQDVQDRRVESATARAFKLRF